MLTSFIEIKGEDDLIGPGAEPGTIPTDLEQAVGLERLEILGKMQGVDVFDMKPLDASRKGMEYKRRGKNSSLMADCRLAGQPNHGQIFR